MGRVRGLEEELGIQLERMKEEREHIETERKSLEAERNDSKVIRQEVNGEKSSLVSKLKTKLQELEAELESKKIENSSLRNQLEVTKKELEKKETAKKEKKSREESLTTELVHLRAEKSSWQAGLEFAEREKEFYSGNCAALNTEVARLRREQEEARSDQVRHLEERVKELSCRLEGQGGGVEVEQEASAFSPVPETAKEPANETEQEEVARVEGKIARLRENYEMLLRTGVYRESDPVVSSVRARMEELVRQLPRTSPRPL